MKVFLGLCAAILLTVGSSAVYAATDVTGDWTTQMQTPDGNSLQLTFHFKQDGDKLTGTVDSPMGGDAIQIANGKVDGEKVYWETSFNGNTITHEGTVDGDEMKVTVKSSDGSFPGMDLTLTRTKPAEKAPADTQPSLQSR